MDCNVFIFLYIESQKGERKKEKNKNKIKQMNNKKDKIKDWNKLPKDKVRREPENRDILTYY